MNAPLPRVEKSVFKGKTAWIKRPEVARRSRFVFIHKLLTLTLPKALHPTNAVGGIKALHDEAARLTKFKNKGLPVPDVLEITEGHIVVADMGDQLCNRLRASTDLSRNKQEILNAAKTLRQIHQAGFAHGRPALRDMTITKAGTIGVIDLEEDPVKIMPLIEAQARDIWLFLSSCVEFKENRPADLMPIYGILCPKGETALRKACLGLGKSLSPYRRIIKFLRATNISRDVTGAYWAAYLLAIDAKDPE